MAGEPIRTGLVLLAATGPPEPSPPIRPGLILLALTADDGAQVDEPADEGG